MRTSILICLFMFCNDLKAQGDNVHHTSLHQSDTRIHVTLHHNRTISLGAQFYGVKIRNNTSDILRVKLQFYCDMVCGERLSQNIGFGDGITIMPGETKGGSGFWDTDNTSFDAGNRRSSSCVNSSNKSKKIGENDYTAIQSVGFQLISIENVSEKKRQEDAAREAEAKRKKEEEERARLEKEAAAKKKKEDEERARLERETAEKKKREEEEKARQAKVAAAEKQNSQANNNQGNNILGSGGSGSYSNSPSPSVNTAAQNRQAEIERQRQLQVQKNEEIKRQQQIAQEEAERKRQQQFEEMQAKIAETKRKTEALNVASQETMNQWSQGNYLEGSSALVNEYAAQGNSDAALTTLAVGTGLEIINMIGEEKRRKEEAEERRAEQARIAEEERRRLAEIEAEKRRILEEQKREFNLLVEENRQIKKSVIYKRDEFLNEEIKHTPTFDIFSEDDSPIYIFYVQADKDYNQYYENVSFPNVIEISINEKAYLHFSPIIAISPNSSGEYPFLKEMLSEIKSKHVDGEKGKHKIYNWSKNLEEIQAFYNEEVNVASQSYFTVVFPEETFINHSEKNDKAEEEEDGIDYWGGESSTKEIPKDAKEPAKKDEKEEEIDYWNTPSK